MLKLERLSFAIAFPCIPIGLLDREDLLQIGTDPWL